MTRAFFTLTVLLSFHLSFAQNCEMNEAKMANVLKDIRSIEAIDNNVHLEFPAFTYIIPKGEVSITRISNNINIGCKANNTCIEKDVFLSVLPDSKEKTIYLEMVNNLSNNEIQCLVNSLNELVDNQKGSTTIYDKLLDFDSENDNSQTNSGDSKLINKTENQLSKLNDHLSIEEQLLDYSSQIMSEIKDVPKLYSGILDKWLEASNQSSFNEMKRGILNTKPSAETALNKLANATKIAKQANTLVKEKNLNEGEQLKWYKIQSLFGVSLSSASVVVKSFSMKKEQDMTMNDIGNIVTVNATVIENLMKFQTQISDEINK